jgi:hypothetical protein
VIFNAKQKHTEKVPSFDEVRKLHLNYLDGLGNMYIVALKNFIKNA